METTMITVGPTCDESARNFQVYGNLLAMTSPVFKSMLNTQMAESQANHIERTLPRTQRTN
jgi:hypothetical protein